MNPIGLVVIPLTLACSNGVFGSDCDKDIQCINWLKMYGCYRRFNDPIQTPLYTEALKVGRNIPTKITIPERSILTDFLFEVR